MRRFQYLTSSFSCPRPLSLKHINPYTCSYNGLNTGSEHEVSFTSASGGGGSDSMEMTSAY